MMPFSSDTKTPAGIRAACIFGLAQGLEHSRPDVVLDEQGYVPRAEDNLLPGQALDQFASDLQAGVGQELLGKFKAVHSSAALAVNCFAPLRAGSIPIDLAGRADLQVEGFERKYPTGLAKAQPPHLDVVASGPDALVAIEPKCLEYLIPKPAKFSERYATGMVDERAAGPWFAEMQRLKQTGAKRYRWLDAAQLIKHALELANKAQSPTTLLYLYWEPMDAGLSNLFAEHRQEIANFADRVAGGTPRFEAISYLELWDRWANSVDPRLVAHVANLRARYEVPAWAWEMVEWKNGRLQSADWMMDLIDEVDGEREAAAGAGKPAG